VWGGAEYNPLTVFTITIALLNMVGFIFNCGINYRRG
jgi:hypothetical protein